VIKPEQGEDFVAELPVGKFYGIGPATEAKMKKLGIRTGKDLRQWSQQDLTLNFGKSGQYYYNISRGIDERPVRSTRIRKSLGKETTFSTDMMDIDELLRQLESLAEIVFERLQTLELEARTLTVKVKYANFQQVTRAQSSPDVLAQLSDFKVLLPELLSRTDAGKQAVRLVGVTASGFVRSSDVEDSEELQLGFSLDP
jgi:DNA polymerase-4